MPPIEQKDCLQKALIWETNGIDEYGQFKRSATSEEIDVRWIYKQSEAMDSQGTPISIDATVISLQEYKVGSFLWRGSQEDLESELPGTSTGNTLLPTSNLFQVVMVSVTSDIRDREIRYELQLKRFNGKL